MSPTVPETIALLTEFGRFSAANVIFNLNMTSWNKTFYMLTYFFDVLQTLIGSSSNIVVNGAPAFDNEAKRPFLFQFFDPRPRCRRQNWSTRIAI
jgi:hypothetical protein